MTVVVERDLIELAERCEKATGPDRELDALIAVAVGWFVARPAKRSGRIDYIDIRVAGEETAPGHGGYQLVPELTGSLDAAENLMPDNTGVIQYWILGKKPTVSLMRDGWDYHLSAETKPLALCAAALRARASMKGEG